MSKRRTRAWRRANERRFDRTCTSSRFPEAVNAKNWKHLYVRSDKLHRARQLGLLWPNTEWKSLMRDAVPIKLLFICSRNQWRSPTGEAIYRRQEGIEARSAGTTRAAKRHVTLSDVRWADLTLVMEEKHGAWLRANFRQEMSYKVVHVLDIPDEYHFMDESLVKLIRESVDVLIENALA